MLGLRVEGSGIFGNLTGYFKATSPDLTRNGDLYREYYQDGFKLGTEII